MVFSSLAFRQSYSYFLTRYGEQGVQLTVPFIPADDPLGHTAILAHQAQFPLLGLSLAVRSNSRVVVKAAWNSFGHWLKLNEEFIEPGPPLEVALVVQQADNSGHTPAPFIYRVHGDCLLAASGSNLLTAQLDQGRALGFVTPELIAEEGFFRYKVLECLALILTSRRDRTPVHAAAVCRNGRAVLLVGRSRAGKSTLSYACQREGFQFLAEDAVYVSTQGGLRLWSNSRQIHLAPQALSLFPELAGIPAKLLASGKVKLTVDLPVSDAGPPQPYAGRTIVCLLQQDSGRESTLDPIDPQMLVEALTEKAEPGFDLDPRMPEVVAALAREGTYLLTNGRDLSRTVALLKGLTD